MKLAVNAALQNFSESWFVGILRFYALYVVKNKIGIPFHFWKIYDRSMKRFVLRCLSYLAAGCVDLSVFQWW